MNKKEQKDENSMINSQLMVYTVLDTDDWKVSGVGIIAFYPNHFLTANKLIKSNNCVLFTFVLWTLEQNLGDLLSSYFISEVQTLHDSG